MNKKTSWLLTFSLFLIASTGGTMPYLSKPTSGARTQVKPQGASTIEERIRRIEEGLLPPFIVKGQANARMTLAERMKHYNTPGISVAVINDGRVEWSKGYGVREAGGGGAVTAETLFQAASVSKPVAAVAALRLVQVGKLRLDEDVNQKLVSWKVPGNELTREQEVTLRGLLSHSAGLTVHGFGGYARDALVPTPVQILDGVKPANSAAIKVDIRPGTKFRYSGGGYTVMQQLLEDVTGKPFPQLMKESVLEKVGMTNSTFEQPLPGGRWRRAAVGHRPDGEEVKGNWHTYPEMAAAGLWTTPSDLARFAVEVQKSLAGKSRKVLSQEMTKQMLTPQIGGWGLGFALAGEGASARFSHGGSNEGYRCLLVAYKNTGQGAVVMTNSDKGAGLAEEVLRSIAKEYGWTDYLHREKVLATIDPKVYGAYVGQYELAPNFILTVTAEEGKLTAQAKGLSKLELFPESETQFFLLAVAAEIAFIKDDKGQVTHLILRQDGQEIKARKIK